MANPVFNDYFITGPSSDVAELRERFADEFRPPGSEWGYSERFWGATLWLDKPTWGQLGMTLVTPTRSYGEVRSRDEIRTLNVACVSYDYQAPYARVWLAIGESTRESRRWDDMPDGDFLTAEKEMIEWMDSHFYRYVGRIILAGLYPPSAAQPSSVA